MMNMNRIISYAFNKENVLFFLLMYLLGITNIVFEPWNGSRFWMSFELFADLYILCVFIRLFPSQLQRFIRFSFAIVAYVPAIIDMGCYVRLDMPITPMLLQLVLQTNAREAQEALSTYVNLHMFASPLLLVLIQAIVGVILLWKEKSWALKLYSKHFFQHQHLILGLKLSAFVLFLFGLVTSWQNKEYMYYRIVCQYSELETQKVKDFSNKTHFYIPVYRLAFALSETQRVQSEINIFGRSLGKAQVDSVDYTSPHIVLIIGESYNRHHSSLYGYNKMTTPFQLDRENKGELIPFDNIISSWNTTCESLKNIFSTHYVGQKETWASAPPFPLLFRLAGYHTSFYSNQYVVEKNGFSDFIEDAFFNNPATSKKMFDIRNTDLHKYDLSLLDDYKQHNTNYKYTLDIFHFLGLHADFNQRYPKKFAVFSAKDYGRKDLPDGDKQILADYDNAILYNDYVLDSILNLYGDKEAIVIFVPDHGERVFDNSAEWGRNLTWDKNDIRQQFDIPFWIWASALYQEKHPSLWKEIQNAKGKKGMTDTLAQLLLHIAGIHTKWYEPTMDILNSNYHSDRKRVIRGERDYDKIMSR